MHVRTYHAYAYKMASYTELASCTVGGVEVRKLKSNKTGIVVCLAQVEGPLVNGYFCLATEAHDHDGLPHTLEHLIFMGSEQYPYKGVLDLLANRCLAQGTNAWTDVDHTCYTVMTAGSEGFLNLLPIYLDHILYPTLTDAAFLTEVHHVNGEGDDAGVVYCEMQARENTCEDRTHFHLLQHMYPGDCGYRSETGGRLKNLRTSCSNQKVRDYHRAFYRPDNLCLIVTGQVDPDELFAAMASFEDRILSKGPLPLFERPWQSPIPSLEGSVCEEVPFPTDEEGEGMARLAWRGPEARDRYHFTAMGVLLEYLTDTPVAPLQRDLVEVDDPFCSDVSQLVLENAETCVGFTLTGVPSDKLGAVKDKVLDVLEGIACGREALDSERMKTVVQRQMLNILNQVEETPHFFFAFAIIGDFLFGRTSNELSAYVDQIPHYRRLLDEPAAFWVKLLKKHFVDGPNVVALGSPSHDLSKKLSAEEKERVRRQQEELGERGMRTKAQELEKAIEQNEIPPSDDVVTSLSVPGTGSIQFHPVVAMGNHRPVSEFKTLPEYSKFPVDSIPFFFLSHNIHSAFVELTAILDTASLPAELRPYLSLYLELVFESPVLRNGEIVPYEQVVKQLAADTIATDATLGHKGGRFSCGKFSQAAFITIKVESEKYTRGVEWLHELLYQIQFTRERLSVVAQKMVNDVARMKRNGRHITKTLTRSINFTEESNHNLSSMVTQLKLLNSLLVQLKEPSSPSSAVIQILADMSRLRDVLTSSDNLRIVMASNINALPSPLDPWKNFLPKSAARSPPLPSSLPKILPSSSLLATSVQGKTLVAGVGGVDSNFLVQTVPCVRSHNHQDIPAILVFMEYLCCLEGPMWRQIRGMGLSYHYSMWCKPEDGLLYFILFKSSQLTQAYEVARKIIDGFLTEKTPFERVQLESAISGVMFEVIEKEKTVADASHEAMLRYLQEVPDNHSKWLLDAVSAVSLEDLRRVGRQYFALLLDPSLTNTAVCCNPTKVTEVKTGLEKVGHKVDVIEDVDQLAVTVQGT